MIKLQKNGGVKIVSNPSLIEILLADGWEAENTVKNDERSESVDVQPVRRGRPKKLEE